MQREKSAKHQLTLRVCYVLCYKDPNYTRTSSLLAALGRIDSLKITVVKNSHRGLLRYPEVLLKLINYRLHERPDISIIGFRGHESFWFLYPCIRKSKIIFDEFINMHDWLVNEHGRLKEQSLIIRILDRYMKWIFKKCSCVLTDTDAHKELAGKVYGLPKQKVYVMPVGADEAIFKPLPARNQKRFEVLFYGNMLPLHGLDTMLEALQLVVDQDKIVHFTLIGGKGNHKMITRIQTFITANQLASRTTYLPWVAYDRLPSYIQKASVCLGGPFGGTGQARRVVTGKTYQFLAMGKPTIIGKGFGKSVYFKDQQNTLIVKQKDPVALAEAILWAKAHPTKLKTIGKQARKLYEQNFSSPALAKRLDTIIRSVTAE